MENHLVVLFFFVIFVLKVILKIIIMKRKLFGNYTLYIVLVLILFTAYPVAYKMSAETIEITITDKERITTGGGENISSKFIIYTENEVIENTDSWIYFKFNSADYQNKFVVGEKYEVKVVGWRIPFLSMYRNVVNIQK